MLILTVKLPDRRLRRILGGLLAALLLAAALLFRLHSAGEEALAESSLEVQQCLDCLHGFGWEVVSTPVNSEVFELKDSVSQSYLALQLEAGFDLGDDLGQMVTRYTFEVVNYPTGETGVLADVLLREGQVIGGDIRTSDLDGFLHSLNRPGG